MKIYNGELSQQIERGLRLFHNFSVELENSWMLKESYEAQDAYLWSYPNRFVLSYGSGLKELEGKVPDLSVFNTACDHEFVLIKEDFKPYANEVFEYRVMNKEDQALMDEFIDKSPQEDRNVGQVSLDDDLVMGAFDAGKLVAAASTWDLKEQLSDIGVLVLPTYKNQRLGLSVVSKLIEAIIDTRIPLYRADYDNPASEKIALRLGFSVFTTVQRYKK